MIDTAIILAGGKGLRLMPETAEKPKAMVHVLNRPIIEWVVLWLRKNNIKNIIISVDHKKEVLMKHLGNGKKFNVSITYNNHSGAFETGDAFRSVFSNIKSLPESVVAMNGDQITNLPLNDLIAHHQKYNPIATIVTCPVKSPYGIVVHDDNDHTVKSFEEKPILANLYMNAGIYVFNKKILKYLPRKGALENTTFKKLIDKKALKAYAYNGLFTTVNDHKDLQNAEKVLNKSKINFL